MTMVVIKFSNVDDGRFNLNCGLIVFQAALSRFDKIQSVTAISQTANNLK